MANYGIAMYAQLAIPDTGFRLFAYRVPVRLQDQVKAGVIAISPLRKATVAGVVVELSDTVDIAHERVKELHGLADPAFNLDPQLLALLQWLAGYYVCPRGDVFRAAYPPGILGKVQTRIMAGSHPPEVPDWRYVYDKLGAQKQGYRYKRAGVTVPGIPNTLVKKMLKEGVLYLAADFRPQKSAARSMVYLKPDVERAPDEDISPRRKELIGLLAANQDGLPLARLVAMGFTRSLVTAMAKDGVVDIINKPEQAIVSPPAQLEKFILNADQRASFEAIAGSLETGSGDVFLLFGVTGSGKTQVYIEAARSALSLGKSVLVLLPEIALTPQAIKRFSFSLGVPIGLWHSRITPGQRVEIYRLARAGEIRVILGVRSAVFVPLTHLGLIIVDEEQDDSFKQDDPAPRYNARDVALMRAKIAGVTIVLGSATPSMESFHHAQTGKFKLLRLPERFGGGRLPKATAIDLNKVEVNQQYWPLSEPFIETICATVAEGKQAIILLNRRGYASLLLCRSCGFVPSCPECRVALTLHIKERYLRCHYCGYAARPYDICPQCQGTSFEYRGIGTQKVEELFAQILGEKGILRLDSDAVSRKGALEKIIATFEMGERPLLLGTKMVAKGHHFPLVNLVGVVLADAGLHLPDFRASEKVFQLLVQAAGRAGRNSDPENPGEFVVQTFDPSSGILEYATEQDYELFYRRELVYRKELGYPPFGKMIRLVFSGKDDSLTRWVARKHATELRQSHKAGKVLGPAPTAICRLGGKYHYQVVLKGWFSADFNDRLRELAIGSRLGKAKGVTLRIDVDPRQMV